MGSPQESVQELVGGEAWELVVPAASSALPRQGSLLTDPS